MSESTDIVVKLLYVVAAIFLVIIVCYIFAVNRFNRDWNSVRKLASTLGVKVPDEAFSLLTPNVMRSIIKIIEKKLLPVEGFIKEKIATIVVLSHAIRNRLPNATLYLGIDNAGEYKSDILRQLKEIEYFFRLNFSLCKATISR